MGSIVFERQPRFVDSELDHPGESLGSHVAVPANFEPAGGTLEVGD
jgi:hypothetical protein